jgi:hypothetical protein
VKPDELRPTDKLIQNGKFASEIFLGSRWRCEDIALHHILGGWYRVPVKPMTHQWVLLVSMGVGDRPDRFGDFQIK